MTKAKKTARKEKISKNANLGEVVEKHPEIAEVLIDYGLHCIGCPASGYDTIEDGAKLHGLSDKEIKEMLERINEVIKLKEQPF